MWSGGIISLAIYVISFLKSQPVQ